MLEKVTRYTELKSNCRFVHRITKAYTAGDALFLSFRDCDLSVCRCFCLFA